MLLASHSFLLAIIGADRRVVSVCVCVIDTRHIRKRELIFIFKIFICLQHKIFLVYCK